ncbi:MAG: hypothetical protein WC758_03785 [Candidatus Woesearchaeota archaeon]
MTKKEKKQNKPKINPAKKFAFIVMLIVFVAGAVYFMATLQFVSFFILAIATFVMIQILNWRFKED